MILKMQCSLRPPSWHFVDHIEDLHFDVLPKKPPEGVEKEGDKTPLQRAMEGDNCADRVVIMNDHHVDYHSITVDRTDRLGAKYKEWFVTDGQLYLLNDEGQTIEKIR